jgi:UPF0716 protein FxsA
VFARLLLLFILLPLADLVLIVMLIRIHWMLTVAWILVSAIAGAWYVRRQGLRVWEEARKELEANRMPGEAFIEGCLVLVAGVLLITPGLITDLLGLSMLLRAGRQWYRRRVIAWLRKKVRVPAATSRGAYDIVDGEVVRRENEPAWSARGHVDDRS